MFEAERFASTVAPASAASDETGIGIQKSSQYLRVHDEAGHVFRCEEKIGAERCLLAGKRNRISSRAVAGSEMPALVELAVVRQMHLRRDAEESSAMHRDGTIVEAPAMAKRRAEQNERQKITRTLDDPRDARLDRFEKRILQEEIVDRVAGERELREKRQRRSARIAGARDIEDRFRVRLRVGDRDPRRRGGHAREAVPVDRMERHVCRRFERASVARD